MNEVAGQWSNQEPSLWLAKQSSQLLVYSHWYIYYVLLLCTFLDVNNTMPVRVAVQRLTDMGNEAAAHTHSASTIILCLPHVTFQTRPSLLVPVHMHNNRWQVYMNGLTSQPRESRWESEPERDGGASCSHPAHCVCVCVFVCVKIYIPLQAAPEIIILLYWLYSTMSNTWWRDCMSIMIVLRDYWQSSQYPGKTHSSPEYVYAGKCSETFPVCLCTSSDG